MEYTELKKLKEILDTQLDTKESDYSNKALDLSDMDKLLARIESYKLISELLLETLKQREEEPAEPCLFIIQRMLKDYPNLECKKHLHSLVLNLRCNFEKQYGMGGN